ncbi:alpha-E domain-containing protein [Fimbriiglobus ruber]|uniref:Protein containing domains DUF403 n=1 Tax=Fimbriiglobus ruber TaxID=1908690 RepID=A0A225D5A3_9BACT|nr:alpha-E domain-containing protein [Fimbriiglobus ruber]OWK36781.1 Protein containing domains DUF403 [Fimbriiglobus ruber]
MISRVAEHCFWMSRYLERAENTARILEVNYTLLLDFHVPTDQQWRPLLIISGIHDYAQPATADNVQNFMTWDAENPFSIVSSLAAARENARIIREVISGEMWERMNYYHLWMHSPAARELFETNRIEFYAQIRRINQLVHGICDATMAHGEPWEFFRFGKYLERTCQTARILDVKYHMLLLKAEDVGTPVDHAHWIAILMSCSGYEPFHKKPRIGAIDTGIAVAEFLIFDEQFPRSIRRCLSECLTAAAAISGDPVGKPLTDVDKKLYELATWVHGQTIQDVIKLGLHEALTIVVDGIHDVGKAIFQTYFDVSVVPAVTQKDKKPVRQTQTQTAGAQTQSQG